MDWSTRMFCLIVHKVQPSASQFSYKSFLFRCVSIYLVLYVVPLINARKICHNEQSTVKYSNETVVWTDPRSEENSIIFSTPRCLDENGKTIRRACFNGTWIPEIPPSCDKVSTNTLCPDEFYEYNGSCIIKYEKFLVRNNLQRHDYKSESHNGNNVSICDESYESNMKSGTASCCYMMKSGKFEKGMHCNATQYVILPHDLRFHLCPENCTPSGLGKEKCFCKVMGQIDKDLARVESIIDKKILSELAGDDLCRIEKYMNNYELDLITAISQSFYGFTEYTNCSIIEVDAVKKSTYPKPRLVLNFDQKRKKLILMIENSEGLSTSNRYPILCLTNAGFDPIRTANIRKIRTKRKMPHLEMYEVRLEKYIGEYWCEAYALNLWKLRSNVALAFREKTGNEYSLTLGVKNLEMHFDTDHGNIRRDSFQKEISTILHDILDAEVRFMKILSLEQYKADLILHLTFKKPEELSIELQYIQRKLSSLPDYLYVIKLSPVEYCLPETTDDGKAIMNLHWDLTEIWERRIPRQLCYQADGIPVSRVCEGNFISGASWSEPTGQCSENIKVPTLTEYLHESLYTNISETLLVNVTSISYEHSLSYLDIYFYSELIKKVNLDKNEHLQNGNIFNIINNLSKEKKDSLISSQILFNATDTLLLLLDSQSTGERKGDESFVFTADNILITSVYPFKTDISGIYLTGNSNASLNELKLFYLYRNKTIYDIKSSHLEEIDLAVSVPEEVLISIEEDSDDLENIRIVFTVFYEDSLFLSDKNKAAGKVVSVTIPGYGTYLEEPIPILMRSSDVGAANCGFWDLGQGLQRQRGEWSSFGGTYEGIFSNRSDLHLCNFSHLTHFALLIVSEPLKVEEGLEEMTELLLDVDETYYYLSMITNIGGLLSGFGILGIYLTGFIFSQWREKDGTKILLNLSTAILLEIIFLQFSGVSDIGGESECKLVGCLLHYTLLSKFCWMLIYAVLQYKRFVKVLGVAPKHLIFKSMCFGWGFAIFPVVLTVLLSPESYSKSTICYVHGLPLYTAVILPVSIVIISNLIVFIIVMYNVTTKKVESTVESKFSILQLYLAILLFSVLGLPWLFAILAEFVKDSVFKNILLYFFCITGTLQGFILFIFYVVINTETRERWKKYLSRNY